MGVSVAKKKAARKTAKKSGKRSAKKAAKKRGKRTAKSGGKKTSKKKGRKKSARKWSRKVTTESTHPPEGLFKKDARTIARTLASKRVSPRGIGSGIRMVQFFINRAGKQLPASRRRELEKAKRMLQEKKEQEAGA